LYSRRKAALWERGLVEWDQIDLSRSDRSRAHHSNERSELERTRALLCSEDKQAERLIKFFSGVARRPRQASPEGPSRRRPKTPAGVARRPRHVAQRPQRCRPKAPSCRSKAPAASPEGPRHVARRPLASLKGPGGVARRPHLKRLPRTVARRPWRPFTDFEFKPVCQPPISSRSQGMPHPVSLLCDCQATPASRSSTARCPARGRASEIHRGRLN